MVMRAQGRSCTESCKKRRCFKAVIENRNTTVDYKTDRTCTIKTPQVVISVEIE